MKQEDNLSEIYLNLLKNQDRNLADFRILAMTSNSLIYPSKISPETTNNFSFLNSKYPRVKTAENLGVWLFCMPIRLLYEFLRNGISRLVLPRFYENVSKERNVVNLTHLSENSNTEESTFCKAIESVSGIESVLRVFLSNSKIIDRLKLIKTHRNRLILRQDSNFQSLVKISFENVRASTYLARKSLFTRGLPPEYRMYLSKAASIQMKRYSFSNLILLNEIAEIINLNSARIILIPYEGHSNEVTLIHKLPQVTECQKVIAYQHAPIVRSQIAFFSGLANLGVRNYLWVTGEAIATIVRTNTGFSPKNIGVIGSDKNLALPLRVQFREQGQDLRVLGLPEASIDAVNEVIETMNELIAQNPEIKLVIRLHPGLSQKNREIATEKILQSRMNIRISDSSLVEDLIASNFSISRSSASLVQGMQFKVVPLFVTRLPQNLLSPCDLIQNMSMEVQEILRNSQSLIQSSKIEKLKKESILIEIQQIGISYFSKVDSQSLHSLIVD